MLANEDADTAHNTLTSLHGMARGPPTSIFVCGGHGDAWPAGDLAVQEAVKIGLGLKDPADRETDGAAGRAMASMRGAAAHLWWSYYRALKKREGVVAGVEKVNSALNKMPVAKRSTTKAKIGPA